MFGLDFADWVDDVYYQKWGRRTSKFCEVEMDNKFTVSSDDYCLVPSGTLYKPCEDVIDYLIIDEAQDFSIDNYINSFIPKASKSISLLGDSNQKIISTGSSIQELKNHFPNYKPFNLRYNYRLPKAIARVAQKITIAEEDLITNNLKNGGDSDYPTFPKPIIKQCDSRAEEIKWIAQKISNEMLDDVAILVQTDTEVQEVIRLLAENGISKTQTHYRTGKFPPYHTINTLDFSNNDLPCILDYYAAKGSEFDNVFIPFANEGEIRSRSQFFVACTRSSHSLFITYTTVKTSYLHDVNSQDIVEYRL